MGKHPPLIAGPKRRPGPGRRARAPAPAALEAALATFAHEIRTPLNGILALAELLAASQMSERERGWAEALKASAEHLAGLTTVIVDGARAQAEGLALQREVFDLPALAGALAQSLAARAAVKGLIATNAIAEDLPRRAIGDPLRLRAAVENLIDNAVKFTKAGRVDFTVAAAPAPGGRLQLTFTVADQGRGLSQMEVRRIFRPFGQANAAIGQRFGGAGLGLIFARNVARVMGGDVTVESVRGRGSTFRLAALVDIGRDSIDARAAAGGRQGGVRVLRLLCAEDNPFGRVVLNTLASALGHAVDFVPGGDAVVDAVQGGGYDAVLMDVMLDGPDGIDATRRIRSLAGAAAAIPIIGISGAGGRHERAARAAGMNAYLVKPVSPHALADALVSVTASRETETVSP